MPDISKITATLDDGWIILSYNGTQYCETKLKKPASLHIETAEAIEDTMPWLERHYLLVESNYGCPRLSTQPSRFCSPGRYSGRLPS